VALAPLQAPGSGDAVRIDLLLLVLVLLLLLLFLLILPRLQVPGRGDAWLV
jgi:hypothetical protein